LKTFGDGVTETSLNGTVVVAPSVTTTYTLSCVNSNGSVSSNAKVTVSGSSRCEQNPNGAGCPGR
jgi:hypothetical protein